MPLAYPLMSNFNGGELTPIAYARPDLKRYSVSVKVLENFLPLIQGGVTRRPGTHYVAATKSASTNVLLVPFVFSDDDAFILEFGDQYVRFYYNRERVLLSGSPYEVATPYTAAQLADLDYVQSADVMYLVHPSHAPRKLSRLSLTNWTLTTPELQDGPYLPINSTTTTLSPAATTGTGITLTASAATFVSTDVGRSVRIFNGSPQTWGWAVITAYTSSTQVTISIKRNFGATTATAQWRLGAYSGTTGYPETTFLVEERLGFAGGTYEPFALHLGETSDYESFAPSEPDGQVVDSNAITVNVIGGAGATGRVDKIKWVTGDEKGILIGTTAGEWLLRGSSTSAAVTPSDKQLRQITSIGSANVKPVRLGNVVLFTQRAKRKVRELAYAFEIDGFRATDLSLLAEHMFKAGVKEMAYQQEPQSIAWAVMDDGGLITLTYDREQEVVGWAKQKLGGTNVQVQSVASIPSPDGTTDDVWFAVKRTVDGVAKQYIERLGEIKTTLGDVVDSYFVDCGKYVSSTSFTTVTGLDHLNGDDVAVLADGATHPDKTVATNQITLDRSATAAAVGYAYTSLLETLRIELNLSAGTSQGKLRRIHKIFVRFHETVGGKAGPSVDKLDNILFRSSAAPMSAAIPLFSGDKEVFFNGNYDREGHIVIQQDQPLPMTLLGMFPELVVNA